MNINLFRTNNNNIFNDVFQAEYNYGAKEEQIVKKNIIINFFQVMITRILDILIYPGASFLKDKYIKEVEKSHNQLLSLGAESVKMKTPDGDIIDGMYLKSSDFKDNIEKYFKIARLIKNKNGLSVRQFILKKEWSITQKVINAAGTKFSYILPNREKIWTFSRYLQEINFPLYYGSQLEMNFPLDSQLEKKDDRYYLNMIGFSDSNDSPILDTTTGSHPTVLITNTSTRLAIGYLMRGCDVMMVDSRGNENTTGKTPTAHKTKLNMETAYQYLTKEHGVKNEDLLLHGYYLGAAPAADLAARRKGVSIVLDRSFVKFENVVNNNIPSFQKRNSVISSIIRKILPWIVDYNNLENLQKIQGHIAIVMDRRSDGLVYRGGKARGREACFIPESEIIEQINSLPSDGKKILRLLDNDSTGTCASISDDVIYTLQINKFLMDIGLTRRVFSN